MPMMPLRRKTAPRCSLLAVFSLPLLLLLAGQVSAQPMAPLLAAAKAADWEQVLVLLSGGADVNTAYGDGTTALHWASYHDDTGTVARLLAAGAAVDARTDLGVTPLWLAAENGSAPMTRVLLDAGARADGALLAGESILMTAAASGNGDVVRLLLRAGADPDVLVDRQQTALMWAANRGHADVVEALLEAGAEVNARTEVATRYVKTEKEQDSNPAYKVWVEEGGYTPLMFAARAGDLRSAQAMVGAGADVNALSASGISPLVMAVNGGNLELVGYLLDSGAAIDASAGGHTALHAAVLRGHLATVRLLLERGAAVDPILQKPTPTRRQSTDYHFHDSLVGATPLWLAARFNEPRLVAELLAHGANPRLSNHVVYPAQRMGENYLADEGEISVLMAAVGMGNRRLSESWWTADRRAGRVDRDAEELILESCRLLLDAGVEVNLRDAAGQSALAFARARRYQSVVDLLLARGAQD